MDNLDSPMDDLDRWAFSLGSKKENILWDDIKRIEDRAFADNGWLYIESGLHQELNWLVRKLDPQNKKHIAQITETLMQYFLGDQYIKKTHKPSIGDLRPKKIRNQKRKGVKTIDSRKTTRILFIPN